MRVGYLGPPGTFSEEALRASPLSADGEAVPFGSIHETVMAVEAGTVDRALVPIENALEGGVRATLDALAVDVSHPQALAQCARFLRAEVPGAEVRAATSTAEAVRTVAAAEEPWAAL